MEDKLYKAWQNAGKYYDLPDYDTFKEDMKDEGKLHRFHESLGKYYDVPDYDTFKADMGLSTTAQQSTGQAGSGGAAAQVTGQPTGAAPQGAGVASAGEMVAQGAQPGGQEWFSSEELADLNRPTPAGYARDSRNRLSKTDDGYVRAVGMTPEEQAIQERMSQVGEIYDEPEAYSFEPDAGDGKMHYSWRNGRRVGQLDRGALRFAHIGRDYSSEAYRQAEQEAADMTDEQLKAAFDGLYASYINGGDDALTQGYGREDASRMMAYATEMRYRDIGMGHARDYGSDGKPSATGVYHYHAARMNPAVSKEMDVQDKMGWDQRLSYLSGVLQDQRARENTVNTGVDTAEDRKALEADRRKLLAGVMLYARDNNIYPEDAYRIVVGAANNATPKDSGFWAGFTSTTSQMWRDVKYFFGEAANLVANDRGDVLDAISALDKYGEDAETKLIAGTLHNMGLMGMLMFDGDEAGASEGAGRILADCIVKGKDGRIDIDATRAALLAKLKTTYSWGDRTMRDNVYNTAMAKQVEGDAAWWGQQVAQLVPTTAAIVVGVTTRNPALAETIGQLGMGYMCISSGSQAMQEARMYGADDNQVWTAGIVNAALEYLTEKIPFDRYTKRVFGEVKAASARKLMDAVVDVNNPAHHELQQLLESAMKELGANKGKIAKAYTGDLLAEGSSEFVAGVLQKASEIMYKNPEDYPTFMEILEDGVEGFKGGAAMGGIMSSVSNSATYAQADNRRRKAGVVSVGLYEGEDGMGVPVEIIDHDRAGNYIVLDGQHNELIVAPGKLKGVTTYTYDEWKRGEVQQQDDEAQSRGYNAQGEEREQVQDDLQRAEQRLDELGFDLSSFEGWTSEAFEQRIASGEHDYTDEDIEAIREYFRAKAASDGINQRVEDDIDTQVQQASDLVDKQTNQGTGMVHRATLNNGQEVYVTGGQLVMTGDGTMIDTEASDESLFVYNPATGQPEQYTPQDFQSVEDPISPDRLKSEAARDIRQTMLQQAEADMNGYVQQGGSYDMMDEQGNTMHGTVVELRPDNTAVVQMDGAPQPMVLPTQNVQAWVDNAKQKRMSVDNGAGQTGLPGRTGRTAAEGRGEAATQKTAPVAPAPVESLPMDEKTGEPVWNQTTPEQGYNHLMQSGLTSEDIGTMIDDRIAQADAAIEKASHGGTIDQRLQARQTKDYWENVKQLHEAATTGQSGRAGLPGQSGQTTTNGRGATAAQGAAQPGTAAATTTPAGAPAGTVRVNANQAETMPVGDVAVNIDGTRAEDRGQLGIRREDTAYFLKTMSPRMMGLLDKVAKSLGWKIRLYNGENANERGHYLNGVVWVNRRAMTSKLAQWILGHEMTHGMGARTGGGETFMDYIKLANKLKRQELGDAAYEQYIKDTIDAYKEHLKKLNMDTSQVDRAYIEEEIACDVTGDLLMNNPEMIGKLFRGVESPGRVKRIIDMIVDFLDYLKSKLPFRSAERRALDDLSKRLNSLYRDAKAQTDIAKATASEEGSRIEGEDGERTGSGSFSITGNAEGSGFTCSETVLEVWRVPQEDGTYKEEEHWVKKPLLDSEGNVVFRMNGREFSVNNPITVDDLKSNPDTALNYMLSDALRAGTIDEVKADQVRQQYADMLNLYLEKGVADENGNGFENLEKKWLWVGETVFRTVASNSDEQYSYSIDITKVCKKNEAVIRAISALQVKNGYGVTPAQILEIYEATDAEGFQVPCPVCYVFSRYINNGKYATAIVNGMQKYGKYLPGQPDAWPVEKWVEVMNAAKDQTDKMETALKHANEDVKIILQQIDTLCREITGGGLSAEEAESKRRHVLALDQRYRAALDVISQEAIPRWIKAFVLEGSDQGGWRLREDAALPEDMDDFIAHALDIRKTASAMERYPSITRYRRAGGSAGGKEITFASNNELGTIIMGLGISKGNLDDYPNYYQLAAEAATDEERQAYLQKARERFDNARLYVQRQTLRGGQRMWSWSDNIESLSSDVASNLMQLELLGGALQTYSKQLEGVKMVAAMNGYVNASLMGYGDGIREVGPDDIIEVGPDKKRYLKRDILDVNNKGRERIIANGYDPDTRTGTPVYHNEADGKDYVLVFDDVVGIDPFGRDGKRGLFSLNEEYDRAGNILVGMNDIHVRAAMADPRVFFIIPWHASGMHNHILRQMFNILGVNMDRFVSTDYTNMQEETNFLQRTEKGKLKYTVSADVEAFWDSHSFEDEFACGTGHVENGDHQGGLSESQLHYRELRDAIFDGTIDNEDKKDWKDQVEADEFLSQVYRQVTTHVADGKMTEKDKEFIYPYEYWDETSTVNNADVNGRRYLEYCRRMGFKPKFTGKYDKKAGTLSPEGNFADDPGYWKLLIDRRMYDRRGNYQGLTAVDSSGLDSSMYDPDQTQEEFNVTEVATNEGAEKIADMVNQRDTERTGTSPAPNLDMEMDQAVAKYNEVTALQASLIKAEKNALEAVEKAKQRFEKAREKEAADVDGRKAKSVARAKESARKAMEVAREKAREVDEIAGQLGTVRDDIAQYGTTPTDEARFSLNTGDAAELSDAGMRFSIRTKPAPKKTLPVYKLMRLGDDGKLYPLYIDGAVPIELGQWYDADSPNMDMLVNLPAGVHLINPETGEATSLEDYNKQRGITKKSKYPSADAVNEATANGMRWVYIEPTKGGQRRFGGEARRYWNLGIDGRGTVSTYSMRPGWHAGSLPTMRQIGKGPGRNLRDDRFVWVEGEISADVDYNEEAQGNPDNDIPTHIPVDGFYLKATNANAKASQADRVGWYISGAFKANRIMSDSEARDVIDEWNADPKHKDMQVKYDFPRESGKVFNAETMQLEDDDNGPDRPKGGKRFSIDDAAYAEAVEAGDQKKVTRMVKDAVKAAMPNTKAVDRWGKPRLLYHGTPQENQFYEFNGTIYLSSNRSVANEYTHYRRTFGANPRQTGRIMPVFVNLENPLEIDANRHLWRNIDVEWSDTPVTTRDIEQHAKDNGYDGVIIKRVRDNMYDNDTTAADVYIAFSPEQVKSAGPTYEQKKRSHFPWDDYMELDGEVGATYDDDGNLIPLSERFDIRKTDIRYSLDSAVAEAEQMTETNPTDGQKESGNYKKGHVKVDGFDISIEQPKGSVRSGVDADGKAWSQEMHNTYGYIRGTEGVDGDHIDVFLSDHLDGWNGNVYVVDQVNKDRSFDEHKVMYGFNSEQEAREAYLSNYEEGWTGLGNITGVSREEFKKWVDSSHRKNKPFAEYKNVKPLQSTGTGDQPRFSISETRTDDNGNEVYTERRDDGTLDREVVTNKDGSKTVTWFDEEGNRKEVLDYYPNGEVRRVRNFNEYGNMTRAMEYDEDRRQTRHWEPRIGTDWKLDENGVARGRSNGVEMVRYSLGDTLYSNAAHAVEGVKQEKAKAEQWKAMLTKAGGIKAGEDKWMGLSTWLDEHKGETLTKNEVRQFVADNGIEMEEVKYSEEGRDPEVSVEDVVQSPEFSDMVSELIQYDENEDPFIDNELFTEKAESDEDFDDGFRIDYWGEEIEVNDPVAAARYLGILNSDEYENAINETRLRYTTEGLENKREIAFVVPGVEPYQEHDEIHFGPENQGRAVMWVRFGETTDTEGNRVLVIDEVQSNRHQDAREKGYRSEEPAWWKEAENNNRAIREEMKEKYGDAFVYAETDAEFQSFMEPEDYKRYKAASDAFVQSIRESRARDKEIPAAPFEKNWHEVAMKRMLRLAAEEGFDKVAWTTGEQQASRYDLGSSVDFIEVNNHVIDGRTVYIRHTKGGQTEFTVDENGNIQDVLSHLQINEGTPLSELVGKELADKIMQADNAKFEGKDLFVGGAGMRAFYDGMLPQFMNKYGKRWGVKVGEVTLDTPGGETMHSVDVNEDMKRSVMQGQPLFSLSLGAPYQGSKGQIATRVVDALPRGRRFVDLFAGGGAVTHAAMLSGKYGEYRMNDINPAGLELFLKGINGDYRDYIPRELTPEEFKAIKGTAEGLLLSYSGYGRNVDNDKDSVARRLRRVQRLELLKPYADQVESSNSDYRDVELEPGDVVYADIPYEGTNKTGYREGARFDKQAFSDWALGQDVPVYVSEQSMPDGWVEVASWNMKAMRGKTRGEKLFVQAKFAGDGGNASAHGTGRGVAATRGTERAGGSQYIDMDGIRFSLVGEQGAGRLDALDEGRRMQNRAVAEEMERAGKDAKTIKLATGWERGADKHWRYEIPDVSSKAFKLSKASTLADIVDMNGLDDAYPVLKEYTVSFKGVNRGYVGDVDHETKEIRMSKTYNTEKVGRGEYILDDYGMDTIIHEIQHVIQDEEGFASGTNSLRESIDAFREYKDKVSPELYYFADKLVYNNSAKRLIDFGNHKLAAKLKQTFPDPESSQYQIGEYIDKMDYWEYSSFVRKAADMMSYAKKEGPKRYHNSAGEVEARNAEKRRKMSEEERRGSLAEETEDVPRSEQIVRFSLSDEQREAQTHSANFKNWFGDWENDPDEASKVVDSDGRPKVVLHGTPNNEFYAFDPEKAGSNTDQGWLGNGFYFYGNAPEYASQYAGKNGRVLKVYLDIKNPYIATVEDFNRLAEANNPEESRRFREQLEEEGYDGVFYNGDLNEEWVAFRPTQIKSATENNGDFSRENPDIRFSISEEDQGLFDGAKRKFGVTSDIREAGYVLPDGSMLDFSGRHELDPGTDSSFLAGRRATDHRAINQISFVYDENGDEVDTGLSTDMPDFIKRGAIRIDNNAGLINLSTAPTAAQRKVLRQLIAENGGDVQVDFGDGWDTDHYVEYDQAKPTRVLGDIDRYFDEGIKPQSNARFSLSGDGTVEEYNKAVNMTGRTVNVLGRERKPGLTRYNFQEAFQDSILAVKKLQQVVERHFGIKLPTRENAWMYENRLSSINMQERKSFIDKVYEPMMKIADRIMKRGVKEKELNAYLICKHGLERNQVFAARDAQAEADEIARNGGTPDMQQLLDKYRQRDYSGLTGVTGIEGDIADIEAEAQRIVDEFEQKHGQLCNELWDAIRKATQWSLRKSYQSGMMSAATFDHVRNMFQYYVPLRGWSETTAEDVYSYMMGEHGAFNGVLKKAEGRTSVADDPLATIGNMAESALMQGNKNLLKQHLLRMAQNHPTDVCQVRDVWLVEDPGGVWEPHWPNIPEDATPDEIDQILQDHEADMMQLEAGGSAKRVRNNLDIPYRIDPRHVPEHAVVAKVAGIDHVVYINGNPRAAQAMNGQTGAAQGKKSGFTRWIDFIFGDLKRYYSSVLTSLNINFSGANFVRDLPHAYAMTFSKYGPLKAAQYIAKSFQVIPWVFKNQLGKTGTSQMDRYFQEFLSSGSVTGYAHINDVDAWKADNKRRWARLSALGKAQVAVPRALGEVINAIGWFSETLELIPRFTAFLVERQAGKDIATATKAAKDITTNFNKKGSEVTPGVWGAVANTLRYMKMFFNPIVQGMYQFVDVASMGKENKWVGPRLALATMHLPVLGAIIPYLNQFLLEALGGDDDDDYWLLNEYTRRNNVCIFTGNGYVKIPIAPVFRELYGMGEVVATRHYGKADNEKTAIDLIDQLRTMGSVEGQSSYNEWSLARFLLPEHFAPFIDVMNNENFTGGPIYYDNHYKEFAPEYTKAKKSTWSPLVAASKWLNEVMGGDEDIAAGNSGKWMNPAVWQHVITNVGGGFAQLAGDVVSGVTDIAEGKEIDASNIPVAKRFYSGSSEERAQWARFGIYKDYEKEYTMAKEKYQALDKRGLSLTERADAVTRFAESHPKAAAIYAVWEGGIKGADIPQQLSKLGKDDPKYWDLVKEAVDKAEKAMNSGYVRAWEQKRKDRPDSMSDKELNDRFDKSDNDSIRHIMGDEIAKRAGSQDYYGREEQAAWSDKSVAAWEAYQGQRTSDDIKADAELSNLLRVDEGEKDKARIKMLKAIKDELNKIRRGKDATSRSAGVKGLGEGDDERVMEELRAARKQLIEDLKNGSAEQAYRNLERRTMRLGLRKKAKEL